MVDKETKASQAGSESMEVEVQTEVTPMMAQACQTETEAERPMLIQGTQTDSPPPTKEIATQTYMAMEDFDDDDEGNEKSILLMVL